MELNETCKRNFPRKFFVFSVLIKKRFQQIYFQNQQSLATVYQNFDLKMSKNAMLPIFDNFISHEMLPNFAKLTIKILDT